MRYRFERDFLTIMTEVIDNHGCVLQKIPSKTNDYNILKDGHVILVFSYWPKSMTSTWQITEEMVKSVDLSDPYFALREVHIKRFPFRISMNVNIVRYDLVIILENIIKTALK